MLGADPAWSHQVPLCLCPHLQPEPSPQSCPCSPTAGLGLPASHEWSASPSPCPGPLTAAVAGAAGVLLKVGEESVAWAAGRGEAFAQSLVTHWPQGPQGLSPGGQNNPPPPALPSPWMPGPYYGPQLPGPMFLEGVSEGRRGARTGKEEQ